MKKRTGKRTRDQSFQKDRDDLKDFREPKTAEELLAVFAEYGEKVDAEAVDAVFESTGKDRMSVLELTAELVLQKKEQKGGK